MPNRFGDARCRVFGADNPTTKRFRSASSTRTSNPHAAVDRALAVFRSSKDQLDGGYVFEIRKLVQAEVFADELELAEHYLKNEGKTAAAVLAGVVLERTLRQLVSDNGLSGSMLNAMNQALREASIYEQPTWRQIQVWADIRNAAAHGEPEKFDEKQVTAMIDGIRDFVANHMS